MANENRITLIIDANGNAAIEGFNKVTGSMKNMETETGGIVSKIKSHWLGISAAVAGAMITVNKAWNMAEMAAKFEQSKAAFNSMVQSMGYNATIEFSKIKQASAGLIDDKSLVESANKAMSLGIPIEKLGQLMNIARAKARDMGTDTAQAFNDIAIGVGRGSPLILDNLGLMLKLGSANEKMAAQLGKTVEQLTDKEKKMAILNATLDAGNEALVRHNLAQLTTAERMQQLTATVKDLQLHIGTILIRAVAGATGAFQWLAAGVLNAVGGIFKILEGLGWLTDKLGITESGAKHFGEKASIAFQAAEEQAGKAANSFSAMVAKSSDLANAAGKIKKPLDDVATASADAAKKIADLNKQIQDLIDKSTLTPVALIEKQAETWRKAGANKALVAQWTQTEIDKIDDAALKKRIAEELKYDEFMRGEAEKEIKRQEEKYRIIGELATQQAEKTRASVQGMWDMMMQDANMVGGEAGQGFGQAMSAYTEISGDLDPYAEKLRLLDEYYQARLIKMYEAGANEQALMNELNAWDLQTTALTQMQKLNTYAQTANMIIGVMGMMGSFMKGHNTALFLLQKAAAIAITIVNAHAAAVAALAPPPMGLGPVLGIPLSAKMLTFGYINAALIAATAIGEMAGGGKGGASIPSAGGYSYNQPTTPTWEKTEEVKQGKQITIHIHGNVIDHAAFVRELAPYINEAQGDNVLVFE